MVDVKQVIQEAFPDSQVWIHEFSGKGDHFRVLIFSPQLNELRPLDQHRHIYQLFEKEMDEGLIHAFSLQFLKEEPQESDFDVGFDC